MLGGQGYLGSDPRAAIEDRIHGPRVWRRVGAPCMKRRSQEEEGLATRQLRCRNFMLLGSSRILPEVGTGYDLGTNRARQRRPAESDHRARAGRRKGGVFICCLPTWPRLHGWCQRQRLASRCPSRNPGDSPSALGWCGLSARWRHRDAKAGPRHPLGW